MTQGNIMAGHDITLLQPSVDFYEDIKCHQNLRNDVNTNAGHLVPVQYVQEYTSVLFYKCSKLV